MEKGSYRLVNRRRIDTTSRYPEFGYLAGLPEGTILDGEMVVLQEGKPSFPLLQSRDHARSPLKTRTLAKTMPATYIVFDILFDGFESVMEQPLVKRRALLERRLNPWLRPGLVISEGVVGPGKAFFGETTEQGLEGIIAKSLQSKYVPDGRSDAWIKIKRALELYCVVIGFLPSGDDDFQSLILATEEDGQLRSAGKVGTGFDTAMRRRLNAWLWSHLRSKPLVSASYKGKWLEPGLICRVSCMERTSKGELRAPVFKELISE